MLVSSLFENANTLRFICKHKVSEVLTTIQRMIFTSTYDNPFRAFPPTVVNELIQLVCNKSEEEESLKSSYLHLLLISDRITDLILVDVKILHEDAEEIFNYIQPYSKRLETIKINHYSCLNSSWVSSNFGSLLSSAKNLLSLETSIKFNLSEISSCINLLMLAIRFRITDHINSFLHDGDEIHYNQTLKVLKIEKIQVFPDLYLDIAEILQYCVEILEIEYDISPSLIYLHENQKASQYKLQSTCLGKAMYRSRISSAAVQIASLYCRELRKVVVSPADYLAIEALSNFRHITHLTLKEPEWPDDDFNEGVRLILEIPRFGHNLKSLALYNFSEIDFSCIGTCCPNLTELTVEYLTECNLSEFTTNSFHNLNSLYLQNVDQHPCEEDSIIGILSRVKSLEFLTIQNANLFDDTTLETILGNAEAFSKLKILNVSKCGLTIPGIIKLVQSMVSIACVWYTSSILSQEVVNNIINNMAAGRRGLIRI